MKTLTLAFLLLSSAGLAWADLHTAASPSHIDVSSAVAAASPGDTVQVPAGTAVWDSPITITKGIILGGAGIGKTVIAGNVSDNWNGVITFKPDSIAIKTDEPARITGFTIDANNKGHGIFVLCESSTPIRNLRIDHNRILNTHSSNPSGRAICIHGSVYGVADNNVLETFYQGIDAEGSNGGLQQWPYLPRSFGSADNFYVEDNILILNNNNGVFHAGGQGGRRVARYNSYSGNTGNVCPMFDMHGNQTSGIYGTMITEWYGNRIDLGPYGGYYDQRGGWALCFFNNINSSMGGDNVHLDVREEYDDATFPEPNAFVMKVTNSYFWNNRLNNAGLLSARISSDFFTRGTSDSPLEIPNDPPSLVENREFWNQRVPFDGTAGMGCGTLASRPNTCVPGVAYWATDQDVSDLTSFTGPNPRKPISGTLYKCTAPNVWTAYYTPYTYPHPLRTSGPVADSQSGTRPAMSGVAETARVPAGADAVFNARGQIVDRMSAERGDNPGATGMSPGIYFVRWGYGRAYHVVKQASVR